MKHIKWESRLIRHRNVDRIAAYFENK